MGSRVRSGFGQWALGRQRHTENWDFESGRTLWADREREGGNWSASFSLKTRAVVMAAVVVVLGGEGDTPNQTSSFIETTAVTLEVRPFPKFRSVQSRKTHYFVISYKVVPHRTRRHFAVVCCRDPQMLRG